MKGVSSHSHVRSAGLGSAESVIEHPLTEEDGYLSGMTVFVPKLCLAWCTLAASYHYCISFSHLYILIVSISLNVPVSTQALPGGLQGWHVIRKPLINRSMASLPNHIQQFVVLKVVDPKKNRAETPRPGWMAFSRRQLHRSASTLPSLNGSSKNENIAYLQRWYRAINHLGP